MKIRITISLLDGTYAVFKTGNRALSYARQEWTNLNLIKINGEVCGISQLEELAQMEDVEREHNKRQGL